MCQTGALSPSLDFSQPPSLFLLELVSSYISQNALWQRRHVYFLRNPTNLWREAARGQMTRHFLLGVSPFQHRQLVILEITFALWIGTSRLPYLDFLGTQTGGESRCYSVNVKNMIYLIKKHSSASSPPLYSNRSSEEVTATKTCPHFLKSSSFALKVYDSNWSSQS